MKNKTISGVDVAPNSQLVTLSKLANFAPDNYPTWNANLAKLRSHGT